MSLTHPARGPGDGIVIALPGTEVTVTSGRARRGEGLMRARRGGAGHLTEARSGGRRASESTASPEAPGRGGGSAVSAPAAAWAAAAPPRATVASSARDVSDGPEPLGRRPSMNVGGRRTGQAQGSALRGRLLTSGPAASAEVGAGDAHGATTRPPSEAEPAGRAITISGRGVDESGYVTLHVICMLFGAALSINKHNLSTCTTHPDPCKSTWRKIHWACNELLFV